MNRLELDQLPDPDAEQAIWDKMKFYADVDSDKWGTIGLMAQHVEKHGLWKLRTDPADGFPCRSFNRWVQICPYPHSTVRAALKDVQAVSDLPSEVIAHIPQSNFDTMKQLSPAVRRDPLVLEVATSQRPDALVAYLKSRHPDQHILADTMFRCPMNEEQLEDVEKAIQKSMLRRGCASKTEVLWLWALDELSTDDSPLESEPDGKWGHA